eukprot:2131737-Pleurochrysis_carterae.AAC.2
MAAYCDGKDFDTPPFGGHRFGVVLFWTACWQVQLLYHTSSQIVMSIPRWRLGEAQDFVCLWKHRCDANLNDDVTNATTRCCVLVLHQLASVSHAHNFK